MRMGSSSLSSESCVPRAGGRLSPPAACSVGSDLLQPPDVSSVASASVISVAAEALDPPWKDLPAELEADGLPTSLEQEASHCGSVMEAVSHRCPEDSQGAEGNHNVHHHVAIGKEAEDLFFKLQNEPVVYDFSQHVVKSTDLAVRLNSPGSAQPLPGLLWGVHHSENWMGYCS